MTIMRLPAKWGPSRGGAKYGSRLPWSASEYGTTDRPADELLDLYGIILIAVPLALFLRWLWP